MSLHLIHNLNNDESNHGSDSIHMDRYALSCANQTTGSEFLLPKRGEPMK